MYQSISECFCVVCVCVRACVLACVCVLAHQCVGVFARISTLVFVRGAHQCVRAYVQVGVPARVHVHVSVPTCV